MSFSNLVSISQLIASPLFFVTTTIASVPLTVALVGLFAARRRLARARGLLIEADLTERCVGPTGKPDRKGRTPRKGLKSGAEQKPGDDEREESAGA